MKEYNPGDKVWVVTGFTPSTVLLVRCSVLEVDGTFSQKHPDGIVFYWLDEPFGHSFAADDVYDNFRDAHRALRDRMTVTPNGESGSDDLGYAVLSDYRKARKKFITETHRAYDPAYKPKWPKGFCPRKVHGLDWFNGGDIY